MITRTMLKIRLEALLNPTGRILHYEYYFSFGLCTFNLLKSLKQYRIYNNIYSIQVFVNSYQHDNVNRKCYSILHMIIELDIYSKSYFSLQTYDQVNCIIIKYGDMLTLKSSTYTYHGLAEIKMLQSVTIICQRLNA